MLILSLGKQNLAYAKLHKGEAVTAVKELKQEGKDLVLWGSIPYPFTIGSKSHRSTGN